MFYYYSIYIQPHDGQINPGSHILKFTMDPLLSSIYSSNNKPSTLELNIDK